MWHGALTSQKVVGMIDAAMKSSLLRAGSVLKVNKDIFWLLDIMIYHNCNF